MIEGMAYDPSILIGIVAAYLAVFGWLGQWVATQCGRGAIEGLLLGMLLGPFGVLIEALLPKNPRR